MMARQVNALGGPGADARAAALMAAEAAGVRIQPVHDLAEIEVAQRVVEQIWTPSPDDSPMTRSVLRALTHAGNYCAIARQGNEAVGVCVGFMGVEPANTLHSHIAGVTTAGVGRHIGFALKLDQRAWAIERGVTSMHWTFDPLVRRNAYFNLSKLGAVPIEYAVDFYGDMNDGINAGQRTDRLLVRWDLTGAVPSGPAETDIPQLIRSGAVTILDELAGAPARVDPGPEASTCLVRVPRDIEVLRRVSPDVALEWRYAVREALGELICGGWAVVEMSRDGFYVLRNSQTRTD